MAQNRERVDRVQAQLTEVREILHDMQLHLIEDPDVIDLREKREIRLDEKRPSDRPKARAIKPR